MEDITLLGSENFADDDQDTSDYLENIAKQGMPRNEFVSLAKFHIASVKKTDTTQIDKLKSQFNLGDKPSYDDLEKMAGKFWDSKSADRVQRKNERVQALKDLQKTSIESKVDDLMMTATQQHAELMAKIEQSENDDPSSFILAPDGSKDFGEITPEIADIIKRQPGKIKLQIGEHLGKNKGYGIAHIEEGHPEIKNPVEFIADVTSNFTQIWKTKSGRLLLVKRDNDKSGSVSVVQLTPDDNGDFYGVVTSYRSRSPDGDVLLWDATHSQPVDSGIQPALHSTHHEASDEGKSAKQKEDNQTIPQSPENATDKDSQTDDSRVSKNS